MVCLRPAPCRKTPVAISGIAVAAQNGSGITDKGIIDAAENGAVRAVIDNVVCAANNYAVRSEKRIVFAASDETKTAVDHIGAVSARKIVATASGDC